MAQRPTTHSESSGGNNGSTKTSSRSLPATAQPPPSAPRPLGTFRSSQDNAGPLVEQPTASVGAVANRAKVTDTSTPSTSGGTAFTPSARPVPRKLNFKAKVVGRSTGASTVKAEPPTVSAPLTNSQVKGKGSAQVRGRGKVLPGAVASGPFALGPSEGRRLTRDAPVRFSASGGDAVPSFGTSGTSGDSFGAMPRSHLAGVGIASNPKEEREEYSEPEDPELGRVDIRDVRELDWMAPEALRKIVTPQARRNDSKSVKVELSDNNASEPGADVSRPTPENISESEGAEGEEDIISDFISIYDEGQEILSPKDHRLYFFQFPSPFPSFLLAPQPGCSDDKSTPTGTGSNRQAVTASTNPPADPGGNPHALKRPKSVTFAPETKEPTEITEADDQVTGGVIGRLDICRSGAVKMYLGNGIVLEVTAGTQSTFLQHAVHLQMNELEEGLAGMTVLGAVSRRFVVSPDVEPLLEAMELADDKDRYELTHEMDVDIS